MVIKHNIVWTKKRWQRSMKHSLENILFFATMYDDRHYDIPYSIVYDSLFSCFFSIFEIYFSILDEIMCWCIFQTIVQSCEEKTTSLKLFSFFRLYNQRISNHSKLNCNKTQAHVQLNNGTHMLGWRLTTGNCSMLFTLILNFLLHSVKSGYDKISIWRTSND